MHLSSYALLALGICSQVSVTLAGRGRQTGNGPPTVYNSEPDGLTAGQSLAPDATSRSSHRHRAVRTHASGTSSPELETEPFRESGYSYI